PRAASKVHVGLAYETIVDTLPYLPEMRDGSKGATHKAAHNVAFRVRSTNSFVAERRQADGSATTAKPITLRPRLPDIAVGGVQTPTTGVVRLPIRGPFDTDMLVRASSPDPIHFELLGIYPDVRFGR
ncbi:MAG: hypothetical protein AAFR16_00355, partial [Pseudomonadota bacterium]